MRPIFAPLLMCLMASTAMAGTFQVESEVASVILYPQGAKVTRVVEFDIPAGQHQIVLTNTPTFWNDESLEVFDGEGLVFGAFGVRDTRLPPDERVIAARQEVQGRIDLLEDTIREAQTNRAAVALRVEAANAQIRAIEALGRQQASGGAGELESGAIGTETLTALVELVGSATLEALQGAHAARVEVAAVDRELAELSEQMEALLQELEYVALPPYERVLISFEVTAEQAASGSFEISYLIDDAGWRPEYNMYLDQESRQLRVVRKVTIGQDSGEDWEGVPIFVSTSRPAEYSELREANARAASYYKPAPPEPEYDERGAGSITFIAPEVVMMEEPAAMASADLSFEGVTAVYRLPEGTNLSGDFEQSLVTLNEAEFEVELTARANMRFANPGVFLTASFENTSAEPMLPGVARLYVDGAFIGINQSSPMIAVGGSADLGFGMIEGLEVERITLRRETGETGVLTTSNDRVEEYRFNAENHTARDWDVVLYDSVPYSEQEDLEVNYTARPRPSEVDVDGKRGVLAWQFSLAAGAEHSIDFSYRLEWPEGYEIRVNY